MKKIFFTKLLKDYEQDLLNKLRGFGEDADYLRYWVPGATKIISFLNLIDAFFEAKIYKFIVILDSEDENVANEIIKLNQKIGEINEQLIDKKINLIFSLHPKDYSEFLYKKKKIKTSLETKIFPTVEKIKKEKQNILLHDEFRQKLKKLNIQNYKCFFNGKHEQKDSYKIYERKLLNGNINLIIKLDTCLVDKATHNFTKISEEGILIDIFLQQICTKHIHEISDHSVIYLEHYLRPEIFEKKIKGIVLPFHAGDIFEDLNVIVRSIYQEFKNDSNYKDTVNRHYPKISETWQKLPYDQKIRKINEIISREINHSFNLESEDMILHKIELDFRIVIQLSENFKKRLLNESLLIKIEEILKEKLDKRIELFNIEIMDLNKLRLKNTPQKHLQ